jgi:type VI secretion system protein ImpI
MAPTAIMKRTAPTPVKSNKPSVANTDNMLALLKGLGIDKSPADADEEWWLDLGASMRTINEELMSSLRDRAAFKNQFRVNHTMFQIKENNPFKFSASVDDLFRNLYLRSNGSFMTTNKAITEAFGDLRKHEQSMRAGLEGAVVGILDQLAPDNMLQEQGERGFFDKFKRSNKEQKQWRNYIEMHDDIRNEIIDNRESILSDAFVQAYEDKQRQE